MATTVSMTPEASAAWDRVLQLLDARSIACAARVARVLRDAAQRSFRALQLDVSGGQELRAVACFNYWDSEAIPKGYLYRHTSRLPSGETPLVLLSAQGCRCCREERGSRNPTASNCCMHASLCDCAGAYRADGRLLALIGGDEEAQRRSDGVHTAARREPPLGSDDSQRVACDVEATQTADPSPGLVRECGPVCRCSTDSCSSRLSQGGIKVDVHIEKGRKGWSVIADAPILVGTFVCEYAGELLKTSEAAARLRRYDCLPSESAGHALLAVREILPSGTTCLRINIDATQVGNVARFINHSCDGGNLAPILVRESGSVIPRVCLYASRTIHAGEELTFSYGQPCGPHNEEDDGRPVRRQRRCACGAAACKGFLPSQTNDNAVSSQRREESSRRLPFWGMSLASLEFWSMQHPDYARLE